MRILTVFALALIVCFVSLPVLAADLLSTHKDWSVYTFNEDGHKVCFMAGQPKSKKGDYTKRGDVFALITHRPSDNSRDVVSFIAGYTFKKGSDVTVSVGSKKFTLFTDGDTAWTRDAADDSVLATAIRKGSSMIVRGTSKFGTLTTDTYSLSGSTSAYEAVSKACGLKP